MWVWIKKWWWIMAGALAAGFALVAKLLPKRDNKNIVKQTEEDAERIKTSAKLDLKDHEAKTDQQQKKLDDIMTIKDERERLQKLADFACRKGQS